ncbi:MAG: hypothetical protein IJH41_04930 [Eubacterium sp.]|nr:hypothetical protein [Eubacterium sp.]
MAYTALEKMRELNKERYKCDVGPMQPDLYQSGLNGFDLKSCAMRFIHERCEDLRFSSDVEKEEERSGIYRGTSYAKYQIPYNMEMDINRLCLERELGKFLDSGSTRDAYNVYYCYLEIFLGSYVKAKRMVELLSEYENNGSSLLIKHRDHYSHSVYVFALGLAVYESNENYRRTFNSFYHFDNAEEDPAQAHYAAAFFMAFWGLTALFHDIGYPFELPFEQVLSYFEINDMERGENTPYFAYRNIHVLTDLGSEAKECFRKLYGREFNTIEEVLAYDITEKLGKTYDFTEEHMAEVLKNKALEPENYNYNMDHGYFSAIRLYLGLAEAMGIDYEGQTIIANLQPAHVDALTAIVMHNSLFKHSIAFYKTGTKPPLDMKLHPLAWLLMLCDELQCWDRAAYGRNSRTQLQPMGADFDFSDGRVVVSYLFDEEEQDKIDAYLEQYIEWKMGGKVGDEPKLKAYSDIANEKKTFAVNIKKIVDTSEVPLIVVCDIAPVNRGSKQVYLSSSNFLHLHDFAVALNARYAHEGEEKYVDQETLEREFSNLSLEYKLECINQAKNFGRCLNAIHCFYTDKSVDFDVLKEFTPEQMDCVGPMEYERWVLEHKSMGWDHGDLYDHIPVPEGADENEYRRMIREQMRCHKRLPEGQDLTHEQIYKHYEELSESEKDKDRLPFNSMLQLVKKFDGLRIYQFSGGADTEEKDS